MMKPSRFAGQRSQPARFHRQGQALRFLGKIILARGSGIFPENLACGGGLQESPRNREWHSRQIIHEDYENKRTYQKDSGQQMGKDTRAGRNGSHHIQLALFPRYIACMDRRGHHLFQGTLQVPLPYSLFSRGTGHHSVHTEFSGLLKSDDMEHARNLSLQHKGAVRERAALSVSVTAGNDTGRKGKGRKTQTLANRELQGKVGKRFLSDGKVRPQAVSEKIILAALRYFSRKPCLSGSVCRWALVVQRAAKARVFTVKN